MTNHAAQHEQRPSLRLAGAMPEGLSGWDRFKLMADAVKCRRLAGLSGAQVKTLLAIYAHSNASGIAWPDTETIAEMIGANTKTVKRARNALFDAGLLVRINDGGGRTSYTVRLALGGNRGNRGNGGTSGPEMSPQGGHPDPLRGDTQTPRSITNEGNHRTTASKTTAAAVAVASLQTEPRTTNQQAAATCKKSLQVHHPTPNPEPPEPEGLDAGLFDSLSANDRLIARQFSQRDARKLVGQYGHARVSQAIATADLWEKKGEIRRTWKHAVVWFLKENQSPDPRVNAKPVRDTQNAPQSPAGRGASAPCESVPAITTQTAEALAELGRMGDAERAEVWAIALDRVGRARGMIERCGMDSASGRAAMIPVVLERMSLFGDLTQRATEGHGELRRIES